jgi:hypothetical protein
MRYLVDGIIKHEAGTLTGEETIEFFQELIDNGLISKLQGHYGRIGNELIEVGHCKRPA